MANVCSNYLKVSGEEKDMEYFISFLKERHGAYEFDLCELSGIESRVYDTLVSYDIDELIFTYSTAWAPQSEPLIALSSKFPSLLFQNQYEEGGCCFTGIGTYKNGKESDECYDDELTYFYNNNEEFKMCLNELQGLVNKALAGDVESQKKALSYITDNMGEPDEDGDYDEWWAKCFKEEVWDKVVPIIILSRTEFEDFPLLAGELAGNKMFQDCLDEGKNLAEKIDSWDFMERLEINILELK